MNTTTLGTLQHHFTSQLTSIGFRISQVDTYHTAALYKRESYQEALQKQMEKTKTSPAKTSAHMKPRTAERT